MKAKSSNVKLPSREIELYKGDERVLFKISNVSNQVDGGSGHCETCNKKMKGDKMREHIGGHIIRNEINCFTCGFCGGNTGCSIALKKTSHRTFVPDSNCKIFKKFSLASAKTSTSSSPCTNRPVVCSICKVVYWSYSLNKHYEQKHSGSTFPETISDEEVNVMQKK